ncbi:hypothetical protein JOC54_001388 [Alkalihalobacillus xiaoxiensis]|uniref:Uncharacterized protein n=1 Tax=Shouchella xiaoxiensis TaxID=766895 RepID=A0ABS2SRM8_9BACI|nr:hypothetical protein [Shouchella xiaoxiensis]MBM7838157.1 hypothetical protein [Shouchella xiaoxiensis]
MKKHWVVLILPAILMVFIAIAGIYYLNQDEVLTNEQLKNEIIVTAERVEDGIIEVSWNWPKMPSEGIYGTDYIGLSFSNPLDLVAGEVSLPVEPEQRFDGVLVEDGVVFEIPTTMDEHQPVGTRGTIRQQIPAELIDDASITLLHTWTNHEDLLIEDAVFQNPTFGEAENVQYWTSTYELSDLLEN